jgi:WD40 repeat protein
MLGRLPRGYVFSPDGGWLAVDLLGLPGATDWAILQTASFAHHLALGPLEQEPVFAPDSRTIVADTLPEARPPGWLDRWLGWLGISPNQTSGEKQLNIWDVPEARLLGTIPDAARFAYFPDGKTLAVCSTDGTSQLWDIPPRRPWWIEYGLPVVFACVLLAGCGVAWRFYRPTEGPSC